jgi:2-methylcitrate dehydratase PrpD
VVANALAFGHFGWDSYALLQDPTIRALLPKIGCDFDAEVEAEFPTNMAGKLTIQARGQSFVKMVTVPKGEPGNFLSEAELRAKFHGLADAILGEARAAELADAALNLHLADDVTTLTRLGTPQAALRMAGE